LDEKQTSNLKELTAIYLALGYFFPLIKKSRYKSILIRTDNITAVYSINRKSGAMNVEKDMKIIREKLFGIESSTHSRENKCCDGQIE
jgi:hypothetical protein